jgi:hypothetical protein
VRQIEVLGRVKESAEITANQFRLGHSPQSRYLCLQSLGSCQIIAVHPRHELASRGALSSVSRRRQTPVGLIDYVDAPAEALEGIPCPIRRAVVHHNDFDWVVRLIKATLYGGFYRARAVERGNHYGDKSLRISVVHPELLFAD